MANRNPSPATRFAPDRQPESNGRKTGDRDRLTAKFLYEMASDFDKHGKKAIQTVRAEDPARYLAAIVALVPKQVEVKAEPLGDVPDDKLTQAIETLTEAIRSQIPAPAKEETPARLN